MEKQPSVQVQQPQASPQPQPVEQSPKKKVELIPYDFDSPKVNVEEVYNRLLGFSRESKKCKSDKELKDTELKQLADTATDLFMEEPNLIHITGPITIIGAMYADFTAFLEILDTHGYPPHTKYLFLGNMIDRGRNNMEILALICCLKFKFPAHVYYIRGKHECASINRIYGFYDECKRRYCVKLWKKLVPLWNSLSLAAIVDGKHLCISSGLSPELENLEDLNKIQKPFDVPDDGIITDLLWATIEEYITGWQIAGGRGVSYEFGPDIVSNFLETQNLVSHINCSQVIEEGVIFRANGKYITLFSVPNYCGEFENPGGVVTITEDSEVETHCFYTYKQRKGVMGARVRAQYG